jgi:hypothetical protein
MAELTDELTAFLDRLDQAAVEYALCGGLALAVHGEPRFTQNIDLLIPTDQLDKALVAVRSCGFTLETGWLKFPEDTPNERRLFRLLKPDGSDTVILDLLLTTPVLEPVWESRESLNDGKRTISVVSREGLIRMKQTVGGRRISLIWNV